MSNEIESEGHVLLSTVWFDTIIELREMVILSEDSKVRLAAADILMRYFVSLGQSINAPFVPTERPEIEDDDDDE